MPQFLDCVPQFQTRESTVTASADPEGFAGARRRRGDGPWGIIDAALGILPELTVGTTQNRGCGSDLISLCEIGPFTAELTQMGGEFRREQRKRSCCCQSIRAGPAARSSHSVRGMSRTKSVPRPGRTVHPVPPATRLPPASLMSG